MTAAAYNSMLKVEIGSNNAYGARVQGSRLYARGLTRLFAGAAQQIRHCSRTEHTRVFTYVTASLIRRYDHTSRRLGVPLNAI